MGIPLKDLIEKHAGGLMWLDGKKLSLKTLTAKKQTPSVKIDTVTGAPDCSFNYVCYNR